MPTAWNSYVTVESADASAAKASEAGGNPMGEPFDVMEAGRMALIQDPTGAVLSVWEPRDSIGAHWVNGPGAITLNQLNTSDPQAAEQFYGGLFGWRTEQVGGGDQPYWGIYNGDRLNGGMMPLPPDAGATAALARLLRQRRRGRGRRAHRRARRPGDAAADRRAGRAHPRRPGPAGRGLRPVRRPVRRLRARGAPRA